MPIDVINITNIYFQHSKVMLYKPISLSTKFYFMIGYCISTLRRVIPEILDFMGIINVLKRLY